MIKVTYAILEYDPKFEDLLGPIEIDKPNKWGAETVAEHYQDYENGWGASWPLTIVLFDLEDNELGRFDVDREAVPMFIANEIEKED